MSLLIDVVKNRKERVSVADLGALYMGSIDPSYKKLYDNDVCNLFLFEPQLSEAQTLEQIFGPQATIITDVVGSGKEVIFYECNEPSASSCFMPNIKLVEEFQWFDKPLSVIGQRKLKTRTLDDVFADQQIDFLKMDIQGSELSVINSAPNTLSKMCVLQTEADFVSIYIDQPLFSDVDEALRRSGFQIHTFATLGLYSFRPFKFNEPIQFSFHPEPFRPKQLTFSEAVYVRSDFSNFKGDESSIIKGALVLHEVYQSYDVAFRLLQEHDKLFGDNLSDRYLEFLRRELTYKSPRARLGLSRLVKAAFRRSSWQYVLSHGWRDVWRKLLSSHAEPAETKSFWHKR